MNTLKVVLLTVIAVLLVVFLIDRWREPQQLGELKKSIDQLNSTLSRGVATSPHVNVPETTSISAPRSDDETAVVHPPAKPPRDGMPKLGENFLLPYDRSHINKEWIGGTLRAFSETPKGLNPLIDNSATSADVHTLCNDSLCDRPDYAPEQWAESLAESVAISNDYQTYTFVIRKGVMWQRPACAKEANFQWLNKDFELTAEDFVFTLRTIMDPVVECPQLRVYYEDLDKYEAVDRYTLRMHWKRKVYTSLSGSLGLSPLPRHVYGRSADGAELPVEKLGVSFNKHWFDELNGVVGVGAFILDEYKPDQVMNFRRNPAYWGAGIHVERLELNLAVKQNEAQLIAFKNGQVHSFGLSPMKYKSEVLDRNDPRFAAFDPANPKAGRAGELGWERVSGMSFSYLGWNMRRPLFRDKQVRQAMSHAFPKQRIIDDVFFGLGKSVLSDVMLDSQYCNRELKPYGFDLEKARALLNAAGWTDSDGDGLLDKVIDGKKATFSFEIKTHANAPEWDAALAVFKNELRKIGIEAKPTPYEWKEMLRIYEDKDFDVIVGGWRMDWDIDYFQLWHSSQVSVQGSSNHCGFNSPRVDELADKLRATFDTAERVAIAKEIQGIIHEEQPYTFFKSGVGIFVWQNRPPPGEPVPPERYLSGVIKGLDTFHPMKNRARAYWHFRN